MNSNQIEAQIQANTQECLQLQQKLMQAGLDNTQHNQLSNRLEMLKKAQDYWAGEYQKQTGQKFIITPTQFIVSPKTATSNPDSLSNNSVGSDWYGLIEWRNMRSRIRASLIGNPNFGKVESYLDTLQKNAGNGIPKIPGVLIFGKVIKTCIFSSCPNPPFNPWWLIPDPFSKPAAAKIDFNGVPLFGYFWFEEEDKAVLLAVNGVIVKPVGLVSGGFK